MSIVTAVCPSALLRVVPALCAVALLGCGVDMGEIAPKASQRVFRDGRIYALYNGRPTAGSRIRTLTIMYDGQGIVVPPNMNEQKEATLQGATLITPDPLPGGTPVDLQFAVAEAGEERRMFSDYFGGPVVVDGDMTIEFYDEKWEASPFGILVLKILSGKHDAPHVY